MAYTFIMYRRGAWKNKFYHFFLMRPKNESAGLFIFFLSHFALELLYFFQCTLLILLELQEHLDEKKNANIL